MKRSVLFTAIAGGLIVVSLFIASLAAFTVHQTQQAIVFQFGAPLQVIKEPGLHWKFPWQSVQFVEARILDLDPKEAEIVDKDKNRLVVDVISRYRILNPLAYVTAFQGSNVIAQERLGSLINKAMVETFTQETLDAVLSDRRAAIMQRIQAAANELTKEAPSASGDETRDYGVVFVDLRVRRADLPKQNADAIYQSMQQERVRESKQLRAEGEEEAVTIRAGADRERVELIAKARQRAQELRGEGDAEAIRIYAEAFGQDPEFFAFYRSMEAYRNALGGEGTTFVLSPDGDFFQFFGNEKGARLP